jgi:GNAT superfamily N-acetyltransferase
MITIGRSAKAPAGATLRTANEQDRDTLRRLRRAAGSRGTLPGPVERLLRMPSLGRIWIMEVHATPAGYLAVSWASHEHPEDGAAVVEELVVVPALRGRGLGSWALDVASAACRVKGIRELRIELEQVMRAALGVRTGEFAVRRGSEDQAPAA